MTVVDAGVAVAFKASCNAQLPPLPENVNGPSTPPFVVTVFAVVAPSTIAFVCVKATVAFVFQLPLTVKVPVEANVTVPAETVKLSHAIVPEKFTVYDPAWSKNTLSVAVGAEAPLGPPELVDQLVVETELHVPVPPTQNRSAITLPHQQAAQ